SLDQAIAAGIARDGGLFLPEPLPQFATEDFEDAASIGEVAKVLLAPFLEGSALAPHLAAIVSETPSFPIPLTELSVATGALDMLGLCHGPAAAFKDVGAGFLAACLSRLQRGDSTPLTVLVATSGDTGGAVAAAFDGRPGIRVVVLFPD